ncbi:MAG: thermonuclease family protein, partial [Clostridia bacterium]
KNKNSSATAVKILNKKRGMKMGKNKNKFHINKEALVIVIFIVIAAAVLIKIQNRPVKEEEYIPKQEETQQENNQLESEIVTFSRVVDGDTARLIVQGKEETVRFLAIDTPESVKPNTKVQPYGKEASEYTEKMLKNAKEIKLEYEKSAKVDDYDRKLAWVFVDGELLQEQLVSKGYAKVAYIYGKYKYTNTLKKVEAKAKIERLGIWSK